MEQADLGVVQSLYGTDECLSASVLEELRACHRHITYPRCMMNARSCAYAQGPLPGVSAALLSSLVFLQPCVESPRCVLVADTWIESQTAAFRWLIRLHALMLRPACGSLKQAGVSSAMQARSYQGQLYVSH